MLTFNGIFLFPQTKYYMAPKVDCAKVEKYWYLDESSEHSLRLTDLNNKRKYLHGLGDLIP